MTTTEGAEQLLLRPEEVARTLAVSRAKVYELISSGVLRSIRIGRSRRVPVFAVREFIEASGSE